MKQTVYFSVLSAILALVTASAEVDCAKLSLSVKSLVVAEQSKVLEIVSREVAAAPACACEVVKAAIEGSKAKPETVAAIVEAAMTAAPEQMDVIARCALAVAPDALDQVQAIFAKLGNPLNFPGQGPVGPVAGGPGGSPLMPVVAPVIINPPQVTNVNPGKGKK